MLIAKNQDAFFYLKDLFQERKITKKYLALVFGIPKEKEMLIDKSIGIIHSSVKRSVLAKNMREIKEARTEYKVLKKYKIEGEEYSLLEVSPLTGRTNQIRVHLSYIGNAIVGDKIYSPKKFQVPEDLNRMFLHAYSLEFSLKDGRRILLEADLPEELNKIVS